MPRPAGIWSLGAASCYQSVLLERIEHGIDDYAWIRYPEEKPRRYKVQYTLSGARAFIRVYGRRFYFDECFRYDQ